MPLAWIKLLEHWVARRFSFRTLRPLSQRIGWVGGVEVGDLAADGIPPPRLCADQNAVGFMAAPERPGVISEEASAALLAPPQYPYEPAVPILRGALLPMEEGGGQQVEVGARTFLFVPGLWYRRQP